MSTNLSIGEKDAAYNNKLLRAAQKLSGHEGVEHDLAVTNMSSTVDQRAEQSEKPIQVHWLSHIKKVDRALFEEIEPKPPTAVRRRKYYLSAHDEELLNKIHDYHLTHFFDTIDDYNEAIGLLNKDGVLKWLDISGEMPDELAGNIKIIGFNHNKEDDVSQVNDLDPDKITEEEKEAMTKRFDDDGYFEGMLSPIKCVRKALVMIILDCIKQSKAKPTDKQTTLYTTLLMNRIVYVHKVHYIIHNQRYSFGGKKLLQTIESQLRNYRTITRPKVSISAEGSVGSQARESRKAYHKKQYTAEDQKQKQKERNDSRYNNIPDDEHQALLKQRRQANSDNNKISMDLYIKWVNEYSDQNHPEKMMTPKKIQAQLHELMFSVPVKLNKYLIDSGYKNMIPNNGYATYDEFIRDKNKTIYFGSSMQKNVNHEWFKWLSNTFNSQGRYICPILTRKDGAPFKRSEGRKILKLHGFTVWEHSRLFNVRMVEWAFQEHYWNYLVTGSDDEEPVKGRRYFSRGYKHLNRGVAGGTDDRSSTGIVRGKVYFTFSFDVTDLLDDPNADVMVGDYHTTKEYLIKNGTEYQKKMLKKK